MIRSKYKRWLYYATDPVAFTQDILIKDVPKYHLKDFHRVWLKFMTENRFTVLLAPRGHAKSTIHSGGYIIWRLCHNPNLRVMLLSKSSLLAQKLLSEIKWHFERNENLIELYGELANKDVKWTNEEIMLKRGKNIPYKESTVTARGIESDIIGGHYEIIVPDDIIDDKNSRTAAQREKVRSTYDQVIRPMLEPWSELHFVGCLPATENILMGDGTYKPINEVLSCDEVSVYTDSGLQKRNVILNMPQMKADIYELETQYSKIRATKDHPISAISEKNLKFIPLKDLKIGDWVVSVTKQQGFELPDIKEFGSPNLNFVWLLGFMTGDGWITRHPNKTGSMRWQITFAKGIDEKLNQKVIDCVKDLFGYSPSKIRDDGEVIYYRSKLGRIFESAGLKKGAKNKDIPDWVFKAPIDYRIAFLKGLMSADGHKIRSGRYSIEVASRKLIEDIIKLSRTSGIKATKLYSRTRNIKAPNSPREICSVTYHTRITFSSTKNSNIDKRPIRAGKIDLPDDFGVEKVKNISHVGVERVYDLAIKDNHNFIAEGIVVHNTRWHEFDLYGELMESRMFKHKTYDMIIDEKKKITMWPERMPYESDDPEEITAMSLKEEMGSVAFSLQYRNDVSQFRNAIFKMDWMQYYSEPPLKTRVFMAVDLAISELGNYFAIVIIGVDDKGDIYVLDTYFSHHSFHSQLKKIKEYADHWQPLKIAIEANAYQAAVPQELKRNTEEFGFLPIFPVQTTKDKVTRARKMSALFESGRIYVKKKQIELIDEVLNFPRASVADDVLDALMLATETANVRGSFDWSKVASLSRVLSYGRRII